MSEQSLNLTAAAPKWITDFYKSRSRALIYQPSGHGSNTSPDWGNTVIGGRHIETKGQIWGRDQALLGTIVHEFGHSALIANGDTQLSRLANDHWAVVSHTVRVGDFSAVGSAWGYSLRMTEAAGMVKATLRHSRIMM